MSIVAKVLSSLEGAGEYAYYQATYSANELLDNDVFPCAAVRLVKATTVEYSPAYLRERTDIEILFCAKFDVEQNSKVVENIIDGCKRRAFKWMFSIQNAGILRINHFLDVNYNYRRVLEGERIYNYNVYNICGFLIKANISELEGEAYGVLAI